MEVDDIHAEPEGKPDASEEPVPKASTQDIELEESTKRYDVLNDQFLRLAADFDNYRKRTARERETIMLAANEHFAVDILEVADNLERALKSDDGHLRDGVILIRQLLEGILARHGITPIDALKKPFNPTLHEAIVHIPSDEDAGTVVDEVARGYRMHDKVIRYAKVAVSKEKINQNSEE
ncbi:MAG: nucleotide exchange factor GrpE [Methanoregula sp.]|nr:nucleotide exchange factor GrpE [Methanoregula sp.]